MTGAWAIVAGLMLLVAAGCQRPAPDCDFMPLPLTAADFIRLTELSQLIQPDLELIVKARVKFPLKEAAPSTPRESELQILSTVFGDPPTGQVFVINNYFSVALIQCEFYVFLYRGEGFQSPERSTYSLGHPSSIFGVRKGLIVTNDYWRDPASGPAIRGMEEKDFIGRVQETLAKPQTR